MKWGPVLSRNATIHMKDEMFGPAGQLGWTKTNNVGSCTALAQAEGVAGRPGIISMALPNTANASCAISLATMAAKPFYSLFNTSYWPCGR